MWGIIRRSMRSVALLLVICLLALPTSVFAAAAQSPKPLTDAEKQMVDKAAKFTDYTTKGIVFDSKGAVKAGLPKSFVDQMARFYRKMNVKAAKDNLDWGKVVDSIKARKSSPVQITPGTDNLNPGQNDPDWSRQTKLTYVQLTVNEWETQVIINAAWTGSGAAGVYAALVSLGIVSLPAAGVMGLVAAILAFGAGYLGLVDTLGHNKGIYFRLYYIGLTVTVWHN